MVEKLLVNRVLALALVLLLALGLIPLGIMTAKAASVYDAVYRVTRNDATANAADKLEKSTDDGATWSTVAFPISITSTGNYKIIGDYVEDTTSRATMNMATNSNTDTTVANAALACTGSANGIVVHNPSASTTMDVNITIDNLGLFTTGTTLRGAFIVGSKSNVADGAGSTYATNGDIGNPVNVYLNLEGKNFIWSGAGVNSGNRAGIEVSYGSTLYIEGNGKLVAKSTNS